MINFEMKRSIFNSFPELNEKLISDNRVNYVYPHSLKSSKMLATQLHPNGNGYVNGKYINKEVIIEKGYQVDPRGWIKVRDFTQAQLREIILTALKSLNDDAIESDELTPISLNDVSPISIDDTEDSSFKNLVDSCLFNWLGYGQVNSPIWFMGMEEGGAEVWRNKTKTLRQSLEIRSTFSHQMVFGKTCTMFH